MKNLLVQVEKGRLDFLHRVRSKWGTYVRSDPNVSQADNLDARSLSYRKLLRAKNDIRIIVKHPAFSFYWKLYSAYLRRLQATEEIITVDGYLWTPKRLVVEKVARHKTTILRAASSFSIDPHTLGAIVIDEVTRFSGLDFLEDPTAFIGRDTTVGISQIRIETARGLIKAGYYNPNPHDPELSPTRIDKASKAHLYQYLIQPKHNIYFAAGRIMEIIDFWSPHIDISQRTDMIQFAYARGEISLEQLMRLDDRARQTREEFYPLARTILSGK